MTETIASANAAASTLFLGHSGEWWDSWLIICAVIAGLAATGVGVTTAGSIISHKREATAAKAELERFKLESGRRISEANAAADAAKTEAAKASEAVAKANERAATLEREAAHARLEQERLKAQLAWRVIPPAAVAKLQAELSKKPGKVNVKHVANDPEALYLAIQIANVFAEAGWQIGMEAATLAGTVAFGLWMPDSQAPDTEFVRSAFRAVGIGFSTDALPPIGMSFGNSVPDAPVVFIGSKPLIQ